MGLSEVAFPHVLATRVTLTWGVVTDPLWHGRTVRQSRMPARVPLAMPATLLGHLAVHHSPVPMPGCAGALRWAGAAFLARHRCSPPLLVRLLGFHRTPPGRVAGGLMPPGWVARIRALESRPIPCPGVAWRPTSPWEMPLLPSCHPETCRSVRRQPRAIARHPRIRHLTDISWVCVAHPSLARPFTVLGASALAVSYSPHTLPVSWRVVSTLRVGGF